MFSKCENLGELYIDGKKLVNAVSVSSSKFNNSDAINFRGTIEGILQLDTTNFKNASQKLMQSIRKLNKKSSKEQGKLKYLKRMKNRNKLYLRNK